MVVKIKDEGQPFDIKRVAYPMVAASMLRTIAFAWVCSTEVADSLGGQYWDSGYGTSFEHWGNDRKREMCKVMTEGLKLGKTIMFDYYSTRESVEEQLNAR